MFEKVSSIFYQFVRNILKITRKVIFLIWVNLKILARYTNDLRRNADKKAYDVCIYIYIALGLSPLHKLVQHICKGSAIPDLFRLELPKSCKYLHDQSYEHLTEAEDFLMSNDRIPKIWLLLYGCDNNSNLTEI
jgi:hypothetical protein